MDNGIKTKLLREEQEEGDLKQRIWVESKKIWRVALPSVISRVCAFGALVVTQSFIGHLSETDLAGYALVQAVSVRFVNGILIGMSSATETLCGQAFGAGQNHMMGIYLQRSWIIDFITLTILLPIFIFGTQIFKLVGEEESIANSGGYISLWFIPFVYYYVFGLTMQMFLQAQLKNMIIAWLSLFQFAIHIPLSLFFVYKLNMGLEGAMIALLLSSWFLVIGEFIYIFGGWCPHSWKGFTFAAFKDLMPLVKLSISSGVMLCLELWYYAILVLLAGYMPDAKVAISAFAICLNMNSWELMISLGFLGSACVRVANELGRGNAKAVKFSIKVLLGTSIAIGVFFFVLCLAFGNKLAYLFTDDQRVADTISNLSLLLSFSILFNSIYPVLSGVAIGAGMQGIVAVVNLVCFYVIGIPLGSLLGYLTTLGVKGIWTGMIFGVVSQTITIGYITWRTDWDVQVEKASKRLERFYLNSNENNEQISNDINLNVWELMISPGFLGAACVRVANELGRGNAKAVKFSIKVLLGTSLAIGLFFFVLCLVFGKKLAYLFTDDDRVADTVSGLSLLLSFSILLNNISPVLSGVATGAGMQGVVAIVNVVCYYVIGIPLGALLGYFTSLQVKGIWIGMIVGVVAQTITLIYLAWKTDWDDQVKKNSEHLNRFYMDSNDENTRQISNES